MRFCITPNHFFYLRFEVLTAPNMKITLFWGEMPFFVCVFVI
jgi:hypothetical protein